MVTSLTAITVTLPYATTVSSVTATTSVVVPSLIASVTDSAYPAAATQCTGILVSDIWIPNSVGRTPVNKPFWPNIVDCCDGAAVEIWASDSGCEAYCSRDAAGSDQRNITEIYQCMAAYHVDYENGIECDGCAPSVSVIAQGLVAVTRLVGTSSSTVSSSTASASTTASASSAMITSMASPSAVSTASSASTSTHSGSASRAEVGTFGMMLLGLAMLLR